ncbi:hypothetical protein LXL04_017357 [Taraxacum kok-saghyz]
MKPFISTYFLHGHKLNAFYFNPMCTIELNFKVNITRVGQMLVQVRTIIKFENGGTNLDRYKSHTGNIAKRRSTITPTHQLWQPRVRVYSEEKPARPHILHLAHPLKGFDCRSVKTGSRTQLAGQGKSPTCF